MKRAPLKTALASWAPSINVIITILKHIKYCSKSKKNTHLKREVFFLWEYLNLWSNCLNGQFQKISIPKQGRLPCFKPSLPSEIPKCVTPPCPQNSIMVNPLPFRISGFFWKYIFDLATPIWTNEHEFMPPQGCDLAAPGDKLYSSATRKTYR